MLLGGSNTGVNIAMAKVAAAKKVPFFSIGAGRLSLTNEDCTAYTVHYVYDTTALANGTATAVVEPPAARTGSYLTADYAFGTQLQSAAAKVVETHGGKNLGSVRVPLGAADFSSFLLQAQGSGAQVLGLANAGTDFSNSLKAATEFGVTRTMKPAALLAFLTDIHSVGPADRAGPVPDHRLVLGSERRDARLRQALFRQDEPRTDHGSGRHLFRRDYLPQGGEGSRNDRCRQGHGAAEEARRSMTCLRRAATCAPTGR